MTTTDIRHFRRHPINATNIGGVQVTSDTPEDDQVLLYNATTGYYELGNSMNLSEPTTFSNDFTLTDTTQIGTNGTPLHELRFGTFVTTFTNVGSFATVGDTITFSPQFSGVPNVQCIVYSANNTDVSFDVCVAGTPTVNSFDFNLSNALIGSTNGPFSVHWIAYR